MQKFNEAYNETMKLYENVEMGYALERMEKFFWNFCDNYIEIAKNSNIPYSDTENMTPTERYYILEFIAEEVKKTNEALEKRKQELSANKK